MQGTCARDMGLIPGLGRSPGEGNGNLLQYSYLLQSLVVYNPWGCKRVKHDWVTQQQQNNAEQINFLI